MHRNITAIYRTHAVAEDVRRQIVALGVADGHVHVVPNAADDLPAGAQRDEHAYRGEMDHLDLPEDDRHTYDEAVRRGNHVVSVRLNKDDESHLDRIAEIMRHPEAQDFDALETEYRDVPRTSYEMPANAVPATMVGRRDTATNYGGSSVRGYEYDAPYTPRSVGR